eukprot:TRINITY_DN41667_c0_g1_i1.p1 TRINITY_DN41667_c0_g1~~TRINITY_DN41667_c0_g1_i1.p1  ORF type:complete len:214 (-),score=76.55 TRINITY_DN41667_c0_g1_i1:125-694(-)
MFAEHLAECRALAGQAEEELKKLKAAAKQDQPSISASAFSLLKQADDSLQSLQLEAKSAPAAERAQLAKEEAVLRDELRAKAKELEEARKELLLGAGAGGNTEKLFLAREERRKAAAVTGSLQKSTDRLKEANRVNLESEEIGINSLQELRRQREAIIRMKDNTHDLGANLGAAEQSVTELEKPACTVM